MAKYTSLQPPTSSGSTPTTTFPKTSIDDSQGITSLSGSPICMETRISRSLQNVNDEDMGMKPPVGAIPTPMADRKKVDILQAVSLDESEGDNYAVFKDISPAMRNEIPYDDAKLWPSPSLSSPPDVLQGIPYALDSSAEAVVSPRSPASTTVWYTQPEPCGQHIPNPSSLASLLDNPSSPTPPTNREAYPDPWLDGANLTNSFIPESRAPAPAAHRSQSPAPISAISALRGYVLRRCVALGAQGAVYFATSANGASNRKLAIKVMQKSRIQERNEMRNILQESHLLRLVKSHPFVLQVYHTFHDSLNFYIVTDYHDGGDLGQLILDCGPLRTRNARFYAAEILLGIQYIHSVQILHRDIKPENVLIKRSGHICIADFGLAKDLSLWEPMPDTARSTFIPSGAAGTMMYMAPEVLIQSPYGYNADCWSYGITVYIMVQATFPWNEKERHEHMYDEIVRVPLIFRSNIYLPSQTVAFLKGVLEIDPLKRLKVEEMLKHPLFADMDFQKLLAEKEKIAPYDRFTVENAEDLNNCVDNDVRVEFEHGVSYAELEDPHPDYSFQRFHFQAPSNIEVPPDFQEQIHAPTVGQSCSASGDAF